MSSFKVLLCVLALGVTVESSTRGDTSSFNDGLSVSALIALYNSPVYKAEKMRRPVEGSSFVLGPVSHSGVRVTLANGTKWLIHKRGKTSRFAPMMAVNARYMSPDWRVVETKDFRGRKTVSDFVLASSSEYMWWDENRFR